jgi:hypothetical protein
VFYLLFIILKRACADVLLPKLKAEQEHATLPNVIRRKNLPFYLSPPPLPVRPSIAVDGDAMRSEDDLTYKLGDIIKASVNVRRCETEGAPAHIITEFEQLLQV